MFWGFGAGNAALEQVREELERMQQAYGAAYQQILGLTPIRHSAADELRCERGQLLLRYHRPENIADAPLHATPLLLVPSLLNPTSLLDLGPNRSLVQYLLGQNVAVFAVEWHAPAALDRSLTIEFYVGFIRNAISQILAETGQTRLSLLGYCSGGILTAITAAIEPERVRNLVQLAAPVDFHDGGLISQWLRFGIGEPNLTLDTLAMLPPPLMRASLQMLKPTLQIAQQVALHNQLGEDGVVRDLLALQAWLGDSMCYPIEAYRTLITDCYRQNALVQGQLVLGEQRIDLRAIQAALLVVTAAQDRICPPESALALTELAASSSVSAIELAGGHLTMLAGRSATQGLWPQLSNWLVTRSGA